MEAAVINPIMWKVSSYIALCKYSAENFGYPTLLNRPSKIPARANWVVKNLKGIEIRKRNQATNCLPFKFGWTSG